MGSSLTVALGLGLALTLALTLTQVRTLHGFKEEPELTAEASAMLRESFLTKLEKHALQTATSSAEEKGYGQMAPVQNQDVKLLQLTLNQLFGREVVKPDGVYGGRTRKALQVSN